MNDGILEPCWFEGRVLPQQLEDAAQTDDNDEEEEEDDDMIEQIDFSYGQYDESDSDDD